MKVIILEKAGDAGQLIYSNAAQPGIEDQQVLIRVKAISINPVDAKSRSNEASLNWLFGETRPVVLGWDVSGTVVRIGKAVIDFKPGDEVFGMIHFPGHGKAYAEYVSAPAAQLALKPANISHQQAAASTLAALTAWQVFAYAKVKPGDRVLIHAAAGGVGHFAVQIAKHLGAYVIATSSVGNRDFILSLGADQHIDYQSQRFEQAVSEIDMVLDGVGGDYIDRSLEVIKKGGILITIPTSISEAVVSKAAATGITARFLLVQSSGSDMKVIAGLLEKGTINPHISKTYAFDQMSEAQQDMERGRTVGKIIITI